MKAASLKVVAKVIFAVSMIGVGIGIAHSAHAEDIIVMEMRSGGSGSVVSGAAPMPVSLKACQFMADKINEGSLVTNNGDSAEAVCVTKADFLADVKEGKAVEAVDLATNGKILMAQVKAIANTMIAK